MNEDMEQLWLLLASEKKPFDAVEYDLSIAQHRRVSSFYGTSPADLRQRFIINGALRSASGGTLVKVPLRPHITVGISYEMCRAVKRADVETYLDEVLKNLIKCTTSLDESQAIAKRLSEEKSPRIENIQALETRKKTSQALHSMRKRYLWEERTLRGSLNYVGDLQPLTARDAAQQVPHLKSLSGSLYVPFPKIISGQQGVFVKMVTSAKPWPLDTRNWLLAQHDKCGVKGVQPVLTELAPIESYSEEGELLPLRKEVEEALLNYKQRLGGPPPPVEYRAWQWLIISHNACRQGRPPVRLNPKLVLTFSDPLQTGRRPDPRVARLEEQIVQLTKLVNTGLGSANKAAPVPSIEVPTPVESIPASYEAEGSYIPPTLTIEGELFTHMDLETFLRAPYGAVHKYIMYKLAGVDQLFVCTEKVLTKPVEEVEELRPKVVAKVSTYGTPVKGKKGSSSKKTPASPPKGETAPEKPTVKNPLKVKGLKRTEGLTMDQLSDLRKFYKISDAPKMEPAAWEKLSNREKTKYRQDRSVPRWAVAAVKDDPNNLRRIIDGELTKEKFHGGGAAKQQPMNNSRNQSEATEAWLKLRERFKGIPLLRKPFSQREKEFRGQFDKLVATYGRQKSFPRLKDRGNPRSASVGGKPASGTSYEGTGESPLGVLAEVLKLLTNPSKGRRASR